MKYKLALIAIIFTNLLFVALTSTVFAQAYSWTEGDKTVYGTNPPKSANNVKNLSTRGLSKYSSSKVLNRLGWRGSLDSDLKSEDLKDLETGIIQEGDLPAIENLPLEEQKTENNIPSPAKLESKDMKITLDEVNSKIINRCKVEVSNIGEKTADNVVVAFEFRDGTLIPASGPASIKAGESAAYKIAVDLLPLKLNFALSRKNPEKSAKVVLDWQK